MAYFSGTKRRWYSTLLAMRRSRRRVSTARLGSKWKPWVCSLHRAMAKTPWSSPEVSRIYVSTSDISRQSQIETRARRWTAKGRVERRKFSKRVGTTSTDETTVDWIKEEALAGEWPKTIEQRAKEGGLESFYNLPYRHGSSFEHSDSWSAASFLDPKADVVDMLTGPSERFIDLALLTLACCAGEIATRFGKFYGFEFAGADAEMEALVKKWFPLKERG